MALIEFTDKGLYCPKGDFYIDPWKPVRRAVITHAHADHARYGSTYYFAHTHSYHLLKARLGSHISIQAIGYGQQISINDVQLTLFPAGHMLGSAQVKIEYKGEIWVFTGDFKVEDDGFTVPFEPVKCHTFITESTFALPIYQWQPQALLVADMHEWIMKNRAEGRYSVMAGYSLGKAQRIIHTLSQYGHKFYAHGAICAMQDAVNQAVKMAPVTYLNADVSKEDVKNGVIIMPPSAANSTWVRRWQPHSVGMCSGWMQTRGAQRRRNADAGFAMSDHADWPGLLQAIDATGAERVYATHGFSAVLARYLREEKGLDADVVRTAYGDEED